MRRSRRLTPARVIDFGIHVRVEAVLLRGRHASSVVCGCFSAKRIRTMDLMPLNPYFHGTTSRSGAPFWFGQHLAVEAHGERASADASPRRSAGPRRTATRAPGSACPASARGSARREELDELRLRRRLDALQQVARAGTRPTGSPSTTPRRSACGRCAPRAGAREAVVEVESLRLRDLALDRDRPRPRLERLRVARRIVLVGAELVVVVVGVMSLKRSASRWC